ncbi:unnamed protein product [Thlaspi arvense]|uniref:F-box domain-containing protein n=1 Tax=Thlaspi arvense TaxID=13288 RepID=A0AAU9RBY3_THLAR|nr:unnamed protein product [Thlaspi arvense]
MGESTDIISDLPQSIIENILTRLSIRDAIRTSVLSSKWRYKWSTLTDLVFDEKCVAPASDRGVVENSLVRFITGVLLLHQGPIHKFQLSTSFLQCRPDIDQWLLFLSRNGIKELVLELGEGEFRVPSCLFRCSKLTRLELCHCEFDPPQYFKGFSSLKSLNLHQILVAPEVIESLISGCPLLEYLSLSYFDSLVLRISAPSLMYLYLDGEFKDIFLENTPKLVAISVSMYMHEDVTDFEQSSDYNLVKFLGGVPLLEKLVGYIYFTKYLSIGDDPGRLPITYIHLKTIELYQVSFEDANEVLVLLRLVTHSPNLKDLKVSASPIQLFPLEEEGFDLVERDYFEYKLPRLETVRMTDVSGIRNELEFIRFLLGTSPVLETVIVTSSLSDKDAKMDMVVELLRFPRVSPRAKFLFLQD